MKLNKIQKHYFLNNIPNNLTYTNICVPLVTKLPGQYHIICHIEDMSNVYQNAWSFWSSGDSVAFTYTNVPVDSKVRVFIIDPAGNQTINDYNPYSLTVDLSTVVFSLYKLIDIARLNNILK